MAGKCKFIILFLSISLCTLFSQDQKKIALFFASHVYEKNNSVLLMLYLTDLIEAELETEDYKIVKIVEQIDYSSLRELKNYTTLNGYQGFFNIAQIDEHQFSITLYDQFENVLYETEYTIGPEVTVRDFLEDENKEKILALFTESLDIFLEKFGDKKNIQVKKKKRLKLKHDFPYLNISASTVSMKFYFDTRSRVFSFFPVELRLLAFPVKYLEVGIFCRFDYDNMQFNYYNYDTKEHDVYQSGFNFHYGMYAGLSFFLKKNHLAFGVSVYNFLYVPPSGSKFKKGAGVNSFFLPQFSFYQRLDIKIFQAFYYSLFVNVKTVPKFYVNNNEIFSGPFHYDFVVLEFSFLGFSIIL